jgi:hypothetical protein
MVRMKLAYQLSRQEKLTPVLGVAVALPFAIVGWALILLALRSPFG